jgi:hypothetical protein
MLIAAFTAFGITAHGFRIGHLLTLVTVGVMAAGILGGKARWLGHSAAYVETTSFSTSFFLLMVFATTEPLTRLPVSHPIAASQDAAILGAVRLGLLVACLVGLGYEVTRLRRAAAPAPQLRLTGERPA